MRSRRHGLPWPGRRPRAKLYIHIGQAKTGTTTIQHLLDDWAPTLEQIGYHVLVAGAARGNHGRLVRPPIQDDPATPFDLDGQWQRALAEVTTCTARRFVVSAEQFTNPDSRGIGVARLRALADTAGVDVEVIGYVRPQWQWIESSWAQVVYTGQATAPFEDCVPRYLDDRRLDFDWVFGPWRQAFGRVTVQPIERSRLPDGLAAHFLRTLGIDDAGLLAAARTAPPENRRKPAKAVEVHRVVGRALARAGVPHWRRARALMALHGIGRVLADDTPFAGFDHTGIQRIAARYRAANDRFAHDYGIDPDGVLFRDPATDGLRRPNRPRWADFSAAERDAVRHYVHERIGLDLGRPQPRPAAPARAFDGRGKAAVGPPPGRTALRIPPPTATFLRREGVRLVRGLRQARVSPRGPLVLRWLRWQLAGLAWRARRLSGRPAARSR